MPLLVGHPDITGIDVCREALDTLCGIVAGEDLDGIDDPLVGHLDTALDGISPATVVPVVGRVLGKGDRRGVLGLEEHDGRCRIAEGPRVALSEDDRPEIVGGGNHLRGRGTVALVVVAALRIEHAVVVRIGVVDRLADSQRVVDGAVDVDDHLRVGRYGQCAGEEPDAVPHRCEALALVCEVAVGRVVVVGGLCVSGSPHAEAEVVVGGRLCAVVIEDDALVVLERGNTIVSHAAATVEFLDDQSTDYCTFHSDGDRRLLAALDGNLSGDTVIAVVLVALGSARLRGRRLIETRYHAERCRALLVCLFDEGAACADVAQLDAQSGEVVVEACQRNGYRTRRHGGRSLL